MDDSQPPLILLKLGGSLITSKDQPHTPRIEVIHQTAQEIAQAVRNFPKMRLILGHGSGSFGHVPAKKYQTRQGVKTEAQWNGFSLVWEEAAALNQIVIDILRNYGLRAIAFPPSSMLTSENRKIQEWNLKPINTALSAGILPVVYGDVVFDTVLGGTILSTEDLFTYLARQLQPNRVLLAGLEDGVWADYPTATQFIHEITPQNYDSILPSLSGARETDVTGGMRSKVEVCLNLVREIPSIQTQIFSGIQPGNILRSLAGEQVGTSVHS
jgi:isopentenyl phosphate kinase